MSLKMPWPEQWAMPYSSTTAITRSPWSAVVRFASMANAWVPVSESGSATEAAVGWLPWSAGPPTFLCHSNVTLVAFCALTVAPSSAMPTGRTGCVGVRRA